MLTRITACAGVLACLAGPAYAGDLVVLESTVPGLGPGDVIDGSEELVLPEGLALTLISDSGRVVELAGPFSGLPVEEDSAGDPSLVQQVASLIQSSGTDVSSLGAIRAGEGSSPVDDPWLIDITRPGTHCAMAEEPVRIWRPAPDSFSVLAMRPAGAAQGGRLQWPEGTAVTQWPPFMTIADGARFDIVLDDENRYQIAFNVVPPDLPSDVHRATWMAEHGCEAQAVAMLRRLAS